MDGDYIQLWCTYNYSGNWMPVMRCTRCDGLNADADIQYPYDPIKATSSLITQLTVHENGAKCTFTCKMSLMPTASENIPEESNKARVFNIPYYKYLWNYTATVSVLCKLKHYYYHLLCTGLYRSVIIALKMTKWL